jgi:hypothetical protein
MKKKIEKKNEKKFEKNPVNSLLSWTNPTLQDLRVGKEVVG